MKKTITLFLLLVSAIMHGQAPSLATIPNQTTCDGQSINNISLNLSGGTSGVTYSFISSNASITPTITFGGTVAMPNFTIATIPGQVGVTTITITATNTAGSDSELFQLALGNVTQGTPVLGPETTVIPAFNNLSSFAFGSDGNIYTTVGNVPGAPYTQGSIAQFSPTGTLLNANYITGLTQPGRLRVGKDGKFYFTNNGQTNLTRYNGQTLEATKSNAAVSVFGVNTNAAGEVFYLNFAGAGGVLKLPANFTNASTITNLYTTNPNPGYMIIDPTDTFLYYIDESGLNTSKLIRLNADGSGGFTQILQTPQLRALAFDESGQLWISHASAGKLSKVNITTGEITDVITSGFYYESVFKNGDLFYRVASGSTAGVRKRALTIPTTYTPCNNPPTIAAVATQTTCQNTSIQVPLTVTDIDMNPVTITSTSSNQTLVPDANLLVSDNVLIITPANNQAGSVVITLTPNDGQIDGTPITFTLNVNGTSAPTANAQTFCEGAIVSALTATGINLKWYNLATGGTALANSTLLLNNITYYVSQTLNGCESARTAVSVMVTPVSDNVTTASACDTYTWVNNGQTYTTSGVYTGTTTNCVTEQLVLTIIPSSTSTTTITACDTYTWSTNGQTYTTSGTYTGTTTGCVTEQLVLTINNSTTDGSMTASAFGSYTWAGPLGSGLTYTTSGVYTHTTTNAAGCPNVATLTLTITPIVNSFVIGSSCGSMVSSLAVTIITPFVSGTPSYMFRVTNVATSASFVVTRPVNSFALSNYPGILLGTQYQVEVSTNGGTTYGPSCVVFTPAPTSTIGAQCGTTLTSMNQFVYATYVSSVTGYRFRVTNLSTNAVQVYDALSGQNRFTFNQLSAAIRAYSTTYAVEVALRNTDGSYLPYGTACNITTPAFPTSEIILSQCDTLASSNTQTFNAAVVTGATAYRFQLTNSGLGYSFSIDRPLSNYSLSLFPDLVAGTTYTVRVAVRIGGVWGSLTGKSCNVTTPGTAPEIQRVVVDTNDFAAITYPNPFTENFMFDVKTTNESTVQVRVYDMLGKQVENRNVEASAINNIQIGSSYPSGVYNVIVSQGENTQTLRVIKR